jgi:hypothetical protein
MLPFDDWIQERSTRGQTKMGCSNEHPLKLSKNYRFFAAFFFAPLAAFFAIVFSSGLATQPPTNHLAVTTGGLSHPPSYQM